MVQVLNCLNRAPNYSLRGGAIREAHRGTDSQITPFGVTLAVLFVPRDSNISCAFETVPLSNSEAVEQWIVAHSEKA